MVPKGQVLLVMMTGVPVITTLSDDGRKISRPAGMQQLFSMVATVTHAAMVTDHSRGSTNTGNSGILSLFLPLSCAIAFHSNIAQVCCSLHCFCSYFCSSLHCSLCSYSGSLRSVGGGSVDCSGANQYITSSKSV